MSASYYDIQILLPVDINLKKKVYNNYSHMFKMIFIVLFTKKKLHNRIAFIIIIIIAELLLYVIHKRSI